VQQYLIEKNNYYNLRKWGLLVLLFIISLVSYYHFTSNKVPEPYQKSYKVYSVEQQIQLRGLGSVISKNRNLIAAPEKGQVNKLMVRAGQFVQQGDVLVEITNYALNQEAQKTEYNLVNVRSDVAWKKSELLIKKYQLKANLEKSKTQVNKQKLALSANEKLVDKGIVSQIQFNQSKMDFEQAQLDVRLWQQQLTLFNDIYQQQVKALEAKIEASEKQLMFVHQRIKALTIPASVSGIVREVNVSIGQMLSQGQSLFEIIDIKQLNAKIQIPQYSSQYLSIGQKAKIITPNGELAATVENIDSIIRQGTVSVYLAFEQDPPQWLKVDQSIEALINTSKHKIQLALQKPSNFDNETWVVYKASTGNKLVKTDINLIDTESDYLLIKGSVSKGDDVFLLPSSIEKTEYILPESS